MSFRQRAEKPQISFYLTFGSIQILSPRNLGSQNLLMEKILVPEILTSKNILKSQNEFDTKICEVKNILRLDLKLELHIFNFG